MLRIAIIAAALPFLGTDASAQDHTSASHACQYNGQGFSLGSTIMIGKDLHRCDWSSEYSLPRWFQINRAPTLPDGTPNPAENIEASANCLYANAYYANGALIVVRDHVLTCSQGAWFAAKE